MQRLPLPEGPTTRITPLVLLPLLSDRIWRKRAFWGLSSTVILSIVAIVWRTQAGDDSQWWITIDRNLDYFSAPDRDDPR